MTKVCVVRRRVRNVERVAHVSCDNCGFPLDSADRAPGYANVCRRCATDFGVFALRLTRSRCRASEKGDSE